MTELTNPARELSDIAKRLTIGSTKSGAAFLSEQFGVEPWSTAFVKIIACIMERVDLVESIMARADIEDDIRENALTELEAFRQGFAGASLTAHWNNSGNGLTAMRDHGRVIQHFSAIVREHVQYPKLSDEEVAEFIDLIDDYLRELRQNDEVPPFVRQSIEDGLMMLRFQLSKIGWVGSGYVLQAFRQVAMVHETAAHFMHETNPDAEAFLKGLVSIVTKFREKVDQAEGWVKAGKALYGGYTQISALALPVLALTHG